MHLRRRKMKTISFKNHFMSGPTQLGTQGSHGHPTILLKKEHFGKKGFSVFERVLQLAPLHLLFQKVPLRYTIANLKNAPGKAFYCALETKNEYYPKKPNFPTGTHHGGASGRCKYSTILAPSLLRSMRRPYILVV